jgi:hypothetical protein
MLRGAQRLSYFSLPTSFTATREKKPRRIFWSGKM